MLEKLGKYEIIGELGKGAMGTVYKGTDPMIGRTVAIKTINKSALESEAAGEMIARFKQEAQSAGRLSHPNIVVIYDYGEEGDIAFISMGYVEGRELKSYFDKNELFSLQGIVNIMNQLLDALAFAHQQGIIHRDIKPSNIMVKENGHIMITDFGIARIESSELTQIGTTMGTPNYMSPEQCMGQRVDGRADIFSAGVILYQLLTGEKPFAGGSLASIYHKILNIDPIPPSDLNLHIPRSFDAVIAKSLAKRPEDRFQTATEFAEAIKQAATATDTKGASASVFGNSMSSGGSDDATRVDGAGPNQSPVAPQAPPKRTDATVIDKPMGEIPTAPTVATKSNKGLFIGIAVFLLLCIGGGIFFISNSGKEQPKTDQANTALSTIAATQPPLPSTGLVSFTTLPPEISVHSPEKGRIGTTPLELELTPGIYEFTLSRDGYYDVALAISVIDKGNIPMNINMQKK
ncbi:MAG: protein kinase [Proteobacteria bacterium]|nr:protein kinase [Pseudomonadota bacterium]